MFLKPLKKSKELILFSNLDKRMELSNDKQQYYYNLVKGYEGELNFSKRLETVPDEWIIMSDLLLEVNNTKFQIDSLVLTPNKIYLFEVKNFQNDYYLDSETWYKTPRIEIKDPLLQLKRCHSLLRQLFQRLGFAFSIEAQVVFINPEFSLFQAPLNLPIVLPTQLNRFMEKLNMNPTKMTKKHTNLAERLLSEHIIESPYNRLPPYDFSRLKKGTTCLRCNSFLLPYQARSMSIVCNKCGFKENIESVILRSIDEFVLLFPDEKITTNIIHEWCAVIGSKKIIRDLLSRNFKIMGQGKYSYYVDSNED